MAKEIKRIEVLDKQQLENILIKLVNMKGGGKHIASNNAKILINKEYRKALGSASLKI
tara:strand:+ start:2573 stop:2746 length:174 start_codon:yes stop_codon:yes gene_type:complete